MKIGDLVQIKSKEWYNSLLNEYGEVNVVWGKGPPHTIRFNEIMTENCGKLAKIVRINNHNRYILDIDHGFWEWIDEMFESTGILL